MNSMTTYSPGTDVKVRKTREGKPKSRNGCMTCKIRRVKCDETKPICQRCIRFGQRCDGYVTKTPSKDSLRVSTTRAIAPKGQSESPMSGNELPDSGQKSPSAAFFPSPTRNPFSTPSDQEAFQRFCDRTSQQLSSSISKDSWIRLVLQACESSPSIQYAVVAIGELDFSESQYDFPENQVGTLKHHFAFRQYQKSTCLLRRDFAGEYSDLRTTFVGCLLFYCFETFRPYQELAMKQVFSGTRLIRAWVSRFYAKERHGEFHGTMRSQDPALIDEEITKTFNALELKIMSYAHEQERDAHAQYKRLGQENINAMPEMFGSVSEARTCLELVVRRSMHWLRSTMHVQQFCAAVSDAPGENSPPCLFLDTNPTFEDKVSTLKEYERWDAAFKPLLNYARSRASPEENFLRASMLRLHWLSGYLSISSNNSRTSLVNSGRFTIELQEMVHIAKTLLKNSAKEPQLGRPAELGEESIFDMQILVPLITVGWIYRHRVLRREAIELLLKSPKNDDSWDGIVVGKVMAWLADIEDEGLSFQDQDEDYIPETAAATCINIVFETERRIATVSCLQPAKDLTGESMRREIVIPW